MDSHGQGGIVFYYVIPAVGIPLLFVSLVIMLAVSDRKKSRKTGPSIFLGSTVTVRLHMPSSSTACAVPPGIRAPRAAEIALGGARQPDATVEDLQNDRLTAADLTTGLYLVVARGKGLTAEEYVFRTAESVELPSRLASMEKTKVAGLPAWKLARVFSMARAANRSCTSVPHLRRPGEQGRPAGGRVPGRGGGQVLPAWKLARVFSMARAANRSCTSGLSTTDGP